MHKCRIILPVSLYDGTNQDDWRTTEMKYLVREQEMEALPEAGISMPVLLAEEPHGGYAEKREAKVLFCKWSPGAIYQIMLEPKSLHVNWWQLGVADMFAKGWRWADIQVVPPPQSPTH